MTTYYKGDTLPNGWYWIFTDSLKVRWTILPIENNRIPDFRGDYLDNWDEDGSKAIGPLLPPN